MAKQTILVVDDETDLLDLIEYNLKKEGFDVLKAENGEEGIAVAKKHEPDLVLLDIMMPKMDGMQAVEEMRKDNQLKNIPIIFLTARSDEKTEVDYMQHPALNGFTDTPKEGRLQAEYFWSLPSSVSNSYNTNGEVQSFTDIEKFTSSTFSLKMDYFG